MLRVTCGVLEYAHLELVRLLTDAEGLAATVHTSVMKAAGAIGRKPFFGCRSRAGVVTLQAAEECSHRRLRRAPVQLDAERQNDMADESGRVACIGM